MSINIIVFAAPVIIVVVVSFAIFIAVLGFPLFERLGK